VLETLETMATWGETLGAARRKRLREIAAWWAEVRDLVLVLTSKPPTTGLVENRVAEEGAVTDGGR
jgi:hypothetical protein